MAQTVRIGGRAIAPGEQCRIEIPVARLPTHTMLHLPLVVLRGREDGPHLWISATLHGDELNGMEIVRRVVARISRTKLRGLLIAAPVVNVFGFINQSRYLPDRRDLNRSFPGSKRGSMAAQIAHLFMTEVVAHCGYGIDLHSAAPPRINLPQVRTNLDDPESRRCARAFGAPVVLHAGAPKGSLRHIATQRGARVLLYEAGEPLRFNPDAIRIGVRGIVRVMAELGMIQAATMRRPPKPVEVRQSMWLRAPQGGVFHLRAQLGRRVRENERLGVIADPFGETQVVLRAVAAGIVIGHTSSPLVQRGEGIVHLAVTGPRRR